MSQLNDARFSALRGLGYTGSTNDMLLAWLKAQGGVTGEASLNDAWSAMLIGRGAVLPFHITDTWFMVLGGLGYTGSLTDREYQFWVAGGSLPPVVISLPGFSSGFNSGFG